MQLHFYVPDEVAHALRQQADAQGLSLSRYLADLVKRQVARADASPWPPGFFTEVVGGWQGDPLERSELPFEAREPFGFRLADDEP